VKFTKIDWLSRLDHYWLAAEDECYFIREYTAGKGYAHSATNDLILNLKKPPDRRGRPEWRYKESAIHQAAAEIGQGIDPSYLQRATFVPIPPHLTKDDPAMTTG